MYNRRLVFFASCLGMLIFGIMMTTLGSILPSIIEKFGIDKISAGLLLTLMSFGILSGSIVFGPIVDRFGYKVLLIICTGLILVGLEGIAFTSSFTLLKIVVFIIGFAGGVINGGTNALVSDISEEGRSANLSLLGVFFGIGAFGVPFILGILVKHSSYETVISIVGLIVVLPLIFFICLNFPASKHKEGFPLRKGLRLIKERPLIIMGFILFFESGMEITAGGWTTTFFNEELAVDPNNAVFFLSLYWIGMMLSRLALGYILKRVSPAIMLRISIGVAFIASLTLILSNNIYLAGVGIFFLGVGFAAGFPVILGYVGNQYPSLSGTAFSLSFTIALIGGMALPYLTGILSQLSDFRVSFLIVPISLCCMLILFQIVMRIIPKSNKI